MGGGAGIEEKRIPAFGRNDSVLFFAAHKTQVVSLHEKRRRDAGATDRRNLGELRELFCGGDFVDDGLSGGAGIRRGCDRSANHEEIGAGFDCFAWGCGAGLII